MPANPPSDEDLMHDYVCGSATAFEQLYARHEGALFRFVRRVLGQALAAQADDVFQDCWLRVINARDSFRPESGRWKTWAFTIAHHLCLDKLRVSGRDISLDATLASADDDDAPRGALHWLQASLSSHDPGPDDLTHWRAAGQRLLQCLESLPAEQRAAFLLHHEDGLSVEALASALSLSFETAKSRLRYALQKLRGCMGPYLRAGEAA